MSRVVAFLCPIQGVDLPSSTEHFGVVAYRLGAARSVDRVVDVAALRSSAMDVLRGELDDETDVVLIADARRIPVTPECIDAVVAAVRLGHGVVAPIQPVSDTVKRVDPDGGIDVTVARDTLRVVQRPLGLARGVFDALDLPTDASLGPDVVLALHQSPLWTVSGSDDALPLDGPDDREFAAAVHATLDLDDPDLLFRPTEPR